MTNTSTSRQINAVTGKDYTGATAALLEQTVLEKAYSSNDWATMIQWNTQGRSIAKGEKGTAITFTRKAENDDGEIVETTTTAFLYNRCQLQKIK